MASVGYLILCVIVMVLYMVVHELGHIIAAIMVGGQIGGIVISIDIFAINGMAYSSAYSDLGVMFAGGGLTAIVAFFLSLRLSRLWLLVAGASLMYGIAEMLSLVLLVQISGCLISIMIPLAIYGNTMKVFIK